MSQFKRGHLLENDYLVFPSYLYMADDKIIQSEISGTISDLKVNLRNRGQAVNEIYSVEWNFDK